MKSEKNEDKDDALANVGFGIPGDASNNNILNTSNGSSDTAAAPMQATVRTTGRVKKPKLVYDPSDNYIARPSRVSIASSNNAHQNVNVNSSAVAKSEIVTSPVDGNVEQHHVKIYDTCTKCGKSEVKCGSGHKSNFLGCKSCNLKWHYACLSTKFESASAARKKYKCKKCRTCCVCFEARNSKMQKEMVICSSCAESYHLECHYPEVLRSKLYDTKWKCQQCDPHYNKSEMIRESGKKHKSSNVSIVRKSTGGSKKQHLTATTVFTSNGKQSTSANVVPASTKSTKQSPDSTSSRDLFLINKRKGDSLSEAEPTEQRLQSTEETMAQQTNGNDDYVNQCSLNASKSIQSSSVIEVWDEYSENRHKPRWRDGLNVQDWSVDDVVEYVSTFYPKEAHVFKFQDIDGASLLLLTRKDILTRFGLKLGRALLLYELVCCLQNKSNDITLAWQN